MSEILRVQNLKKYFKTSRGMLHAVDDVTFSIDRGKTLGVVGESGCGKSTLGRVVLHLLDNTGGQRPWSLTASAHRTAVCPALSGRSTGAICR